MKSFYLHLLLAGLLSWGSSSPAQTPRKAASSPAVPLAAAPADTCWTGYLAGKIPVTMHYQRDGEVLMGEITYLNTRHKTPIRLRGTIAEDHTYHLLEFDKKGTITGILIGRPAGQAFIGQWYSPTTERELALRLVKKEARVASVPMRVNAAQLYGSYTYRYGAAGRQGTFSMAKVAAGKASFELMAVTATPAHHYAEVPLDTISLTGPAFTYALPDAPNCAFQVRFYHDFVVISYTKGECASQFGHNATVEGVYLKTE
ncbi:hypothetical protein [Hymenobacter negativus]|uniref:DUF3108 domain-containing protein n=1 Tax=Hymenobacter negativus TaxID=2795026 RepID=A0ABS3QJX0_9BACT|nr:hypothetical protein [Hymenobacter negativus]MBO2011064.1 hypothetical protein [Hymenobacter negativus]